MNKIGLLAGIGLTIISASAFAEDYPDTTLRFAHSVAKTSTSSAADAWVADEVEKRSNGKVKFQMFWAGAAGAPSEIFDLLSNGAVDAAAITPSWYAANLPLFSSLSSIPFSFPNMKSALKVAETLNMESEALQKEAENANMHVMRFAALNNYHAQCTSPLRTLADFKGKKIRSQGDYFPIIFDAVGAIPVTVLPGEFYESLQRGVVDCIVLPWDFLASNRLYEVAKFASDIDFGPIVGHASVMNLDKWNSLDPSVQKLIMDVQKEAEPIDVEAPTASAEESLELILSNGVELVHFEDQAALEAAVPDLLEAWVSKMAEKGQGDAARAMVDRWKEVR